MTRIVLNISEELFNDLRKLSKDNGFRKVDQYIEFVLELLCREDFDYFRIASENEEEKVLDEEEEELLTERLRELGYF